MPRWVRWLAVLLWCSAIFYATSSPAYSGAHTGQVVAEALPHASAAVLDVTNVVVRKATHVLVFAALGLLFWWALRPGRQNSSGRLPALLDRRALLAWALTALYAASDEVHQALVPGRSSEVTDVLLDAAAALVALSVLTWARRRRGAHTPRRRA